MTVARTNSSTSAIANGSATTFNYSFVCYSAGDMVVMVGANVINPSLYTVAIASDYVGGSVEFDDPPAAGSLVTMQRSMTLDQQTSYPVAGAFQPQTHERALDKLTLLLQQVADSIEGARIATNWLGQWTTATAYAAKDLIYAPTYVTAGLYYCLESHTSGDLADDLADGKWTRILDLTTIVAGEPSLGLPVAAGDALTSAADGTRAWVAKENALGNPTVDGMALVSTTAGGRSWRPIGSLILRANDVSSANGEKLWYLNPLVFAKNAATTPLRIDSTFVDPNSVTIFCSDLQHGVDFIYTGNDVACVPTTADLLHYHFIVRLISDGTTTIKSYEDFEGPDTDATIDAWVFLCATKNKASGGSMHAFYDAGGRLSYTDPANMPVVVSATTTTLTTYDLRGLIPKYGVDSVRLLITGTGTGVIHISYNGTSTVHVIPVASGHQLTVDIPLVFNYTVSIKHVTAGGSVKIAGYKSLRAY